MQKMKKTILISILFLMLFTTGYIYWFYYNPYSDGSRVGVIKKISRKGNIFKTYEGELTFLVNGVIQLSDKNSNNVFYFSVTDINLADSLDKVSGKMVKLHYVQYRKCLPWRGENYNGQNKESGQYIVDRIENVTEPTMTPGM